MIADASSATKEGEAKQQNRTETAQIATADAKDRIAPRWIHYWAWLTLILAFVLIALGAEVTTKKVGMVDPDAWRHFKVPGLFVREWQEGSLLQRGLGWMIEHGHRFVGQIVGLCTIVLVAGIWFGGLRGPHGWVSLGALLAVGVQGLLGIFRVQLHAILGSTLALIHGWTAQVVIALLALVIAMTARYWYRVGSLAKPQRATVWTAWCLTGVIFLQLVLGGLVRHDTWWLGGRLHILGAFAVVAAVTVYVLRSSVEPSRGWQERVLLSVLIVTLVIQVLLGIESWLMRFAPEPAMGTLVAEPIVRGGEWVRSLHYIVGSVILALSVALAAWMTRAGSSTGRLMTNRESCT